MRKINILVVDDDAVFLDRMKTALELDNYSITTASSGRDALRNINTTKFELVLTDLKMPNLSGIEFLKKAKELGNTSFFIVVTGYGTIESAVEAIKAGAYDYLLKPFKLSSLRKKIEEVEQDIRIQEKLKFPKILERSKVHDYYDFGIIKNELSPPFLVISDEDPNILIENFELSQAIPERFKKESGVSSQSGLSSLKSMIGNFSEKNSNGTIIVKGIEKIDNWESVKEFLIYVQRSNLQLIILLDEGNDNESNESSDKEILKFFVGPTFKKIIEVISHPIRRNIILNLKSQYKLTFKDLVKKLSIESASVLSFHLKKLIKEDILQKEGKFKATAYYLTSKGDYIGEIIHIMEELGQRGPFSPLKLIKKA